MAEDQGFCCTSLSAEVRVNESMKYSLFILFICVCLSNLFGEKRPNVIYLNADDLGVMDVGFMGSKIYRTPNLDLLAKRE